MSEQLQRPLNIKCKPWGLLQVEDSAAHHEKGFCRRVSWSSYQTGHQQQKQKPPNQLWNLCCLIREQGSTYQLMMQAPMRASLWKRQFADYLEACCQWSEVWLLLPVTQAEHSADTMTYQCIALQISLCTSVFLPCIAQRADVMRHLSYRLPSPFSCFLSSFRAADASVTSFFIRPSVHRAFRLSKQGSFNELLNQKEGRRIQHGAQITLAGNRLRSSTRGNVQPGEKALGRL